VTGAQTSFICAAVAALWLADSSSGSARAQNAQDTAGSINLGARGGIAPEAPFPAAQERPGSSVEFSFRAGLATDYIYRGTTLSAHQPAVGATLEATLGMLYGSGTIASVKLPSQPAAEISMAGGFRPKLGTSNSISARPTLPIRARRPRSA